ncbi:SDR family NAD(P)-dependent oxidoreductase [Actinocorallia sp. API 0066]|uniref:type I polyketide synthase n=1 Tax=Actinocorallia sp. API 0066 TaxID=2896846 RepID=UPI001E3A5428|nr:type I polyketide synthase [Actinocorallia sp. API 0066]MCD0450564.1 SDR family NAD(P)-dependent oxidoreductase [Actinocorallia sp. API 0066]
MSEGTGDPQLQGEIRDFLVHEIARRADLAADAVDVDRPLEEFGLASRDAVAIAGELEELLGRSLPATLVWEHPTIARIAAALSGAEPEPAPAQSVQAAQNAARAADEPVAVVGVGCRFPGGIDGPEAFWSFLREGRDAVGEVPDGRWDAFDDGSPEIADLLANVTKRGGFLDDVAAFDARFFGITPREAAVMDPQQRLVLEVAWEALEHAGLAPARLRGTRTGVFMGVSAPEYAGLTASDLTRLEAFTATGAALSIVANRLSYLLDLRGPSMIVDTACSSSLVSTHLAVQSLRAGDSDVALAGGVNVLLSPTITMTFDAAGGTAADGRCKAFDASADGMVRAEGCGVLVLKRLSDARRDGDRVLAVVTGTGVNSDGRSNGLVAPNADAQKALLRDLYDADRDVDYIEAHGTGTFLGDPIEARALGEILGGGRTEPLLLGSVKSNLGHMEAAAGSAGLIKTVLALHHGLIPASIHYREPNPHIPFDELNLRVADTPTAWPDHGRLGRAGVSGFGFGGTNAHVRLEAAPEVEPAPAEAVPVRAFPLSDVAADRLPGYARALLDALEDAPGGLADVAATLRRRDPRGRARAAIVARDLDGLREGLTALAEGVPHPAVVTGTAVGSPARPVFVFSGYGAQRPGMAQSLLAEEPAFAEAIDDLDALFAEEAGLDLWGLLEDGRMPEGPAEIMPVLFAVQVGLSRVWRSYGVEPAAVVGHSMGEVAAAVVAGALSLSDGVKVIVRRSRLMMALVGGGGMAVVGCGQAELQEYTGPTVHPAVLSSPKQTVVTGAADAIEAVLAWASGRGYLARQVKAEGAGHSPQVDPLLPELRAQLADLAPRVGEVPMYTTALEDPRKLLDGSAPLDAEYWAANLRNPVRLADAVAAAAQDGHRTFIELNAHPILSLAVAETLEGSGAHVLHSLKRAPKGQETDDTLTFHAQLATLAVHGHTVAGPGDGALVTLPRAPWRHERHWADGARRVAGSGAHPLLGAHVELPGEDRHAWQGTVSWDGPLLPAAALAEMALSAGEMGTAGAEGGAIVVRALELPRLHALDGDAELSTTLDEDGQVAVHARTPAGSWALVAAAQTTTDEASPFPAPSGEGKRVEGAAKGSRHYRVHPEVLDRCLKHAAAEAGEGSWLPESIASLRVAGPTHRGGLCHTVIRREADRAVADLLLTDDEGTPLLHANGIVLTPRPTPLPLTAKLVEATWHPADLPAPRIDGKGHPTPGADSPSNATTAADPVGFDPGATNARPAADEADEAGLVVLGDIDWADAENAVRARVSAETRHVALVPPADLTDEALVLAVVGAAKALTAQRLWLVTRGARAVLDGEPGNPRQGFLPAVVRVLGFERPGLRATHLDLPANTTESAALAATTSAEAVALAATIPAEAAAVSGASGDEAVTRILLREIAGEGADAEIAWRGGQRYTARLAAAALPEGRPRKVVRKGGAYVITGGYGGIGLVTARLLAERGAGRVVLSGRSGPDETARKEIENLRALGVEVEVVLGDIAADGTAERLVKAATESGRVLRGIVHGAAGMADRLFAEIGPEDLHKVWTPKVAGAWRLHEAAPEDLDFFLVHSSAAALLGSPGQGSYAAANAALDALVAHRRAHGLAATTVNWGTWAEVGGATEAGVTVIEPLSPQEGVEALEALLARDRAATGVLRFDAARAVELFPEIRRMPFYAALVEAAGRTATADDWPGPDGLRAMAPEAARAAVRARVLERVSSILGFDAGRLDPATPLTELGLDSLVAVRIKSAIEHDLGLTVPPAVLLQGASVDVFEDWAAGELGLGEAPAREGRDEAYVMPRDAAERLVVRLFEEHLDLPKVSVTEDFFALGGQEHQADQIHAALQAELHTDLDRLALFAEPTAQGVADVIRAVEDEAARQTVRPLQPRGDGLPFFAAHPAGGTTGCYQQLAALIGTAQPFYGLERWEDAPSVEERAARYVEHILQTQPSGPYRLGGWSFGATLAYETARQLTAAGHDVEFVALFDGGVPLPTDDDADNLAKRFAGFAAYLTETYGTEVKLEYAELAGKSEDEMFALVAERAAPVMASLPPAVLHHQLTSHQDTRTLERYTYRPYDGRVILYKAPLPTPWAVQDARYIDLDATNGLGPLCPNLEIVEVVGTHHLNLLDPPGVDTIAAHLAGELAHATARSPRGNDNV